MKTKVKKSNQRNNYNDDENLLSEHYKSTDMEA